MSKADEEMSFMTIAQIVSEFGVSSRTLHRREKDGTLPAYSKLNRKLFKREDIEELMRPKLVVKKKRGRPRKGAKR